MVQPEPRVAKRNWNQHWGRSPHPPSPLSPQWLNPVKQLTHDPGEQRLQGWGAENKTGSRLAPQASEQFEAFKKHCSETWTKRACGIPTLSNSLCVLWSSVLGHANTLFENECLKFTDSDLGCWNLRQTLRLDGFIIWPKCKPKIKLTFNTQTTLRRLSQTMVLFLVKIHHTHNRKNKVNNSRIAHI